MITVEDIPFGNYRTADGKLIQVRKSKTGHRYASRHGGNKKWRYRGNRYAQTQWVYEPGLLALLVDAVNEGTAHIDRL